jgi:hypothetical protein
MTSRDFCYWLQGYFELSGSDLLDIEKTKTVKNHLAMVFRHEIDPSFGDKKMQDALKEIHGGLTTLDGAPKFNC